MQAPDFQDLDTERLEPGEQPGQGGVVPQGAVHHRLHWLDRRGEPFEVEQGLGREGTGHPDFEVGRRRHSSP